MYETFVLVSFTNLPTLHVSCICISIVISHQCLRGVHVPREAPFLAPCGSNDLPFFKSSLDPPGVALQTAAAHTTSRRIFITVLWLFETPTSLHWG